MLCYEQTHRVSVLVHILQKHTEANTFLCGTDIQNTLFIFLVVFTVSNRMDYVLGFKKMFLSSSKLLRVC